MSHDICEIKKRLVEAVESKLDQGLDHVNTMELGQVIDMIKDLAQAEYYERSGRGMDDHDSDDWSEGNPMDIRTMKPEDQLAHLQNDIEAMWKDAPAEYRKKLKENLSKWSTSLTV